MDVIFYLLSIIEGLFYLYFALATLYIFIYGVAGLFYRQKQLLLAKKKRKFAILIPGYKEDEVIIHVAEEALKQDYPKDKYEVIIIADSFKKKTLDELRKLPVTVVEVVFKVSKKSKALNKCMEVIGDDYDVALILDADNVMNSDVLNKMNAAFERGFVAVQGHRTAKNLNTSVAILDALAKKLTIISLEKGIAFWECHRR